MHICSWYARHPANTLVLTACCTSSWCLREQTSNSKYIAPDRDQQSCKRGTPETQKAELCKFTCWPCCDWGCCCSDEPGRSVAVARVSESACCERGGLGPCLGNGKAGGREMVWVEEGGSLGGGGGNSSSGGACVNHGSMLYSCVAQPAELLVQKGVIQSCSR